MNLFQALQLTLDDLHEDLAVCSGQRSWLYLPPCLLHPGFQVSFFYRWARFWHWLKLGFMAKLATAAGRLFNGCDVHYQAEIDAGVQFPHGRGVVIGAGVVVGRRCYIFHNTTLGAREGVEGAPVLHEGVNIYPGTVIAGAVVVGEYCRIGPNVYLTESVASHTRVRPAPAHIAPPHAKI